MVKALADRLAEVKFYILYLILQLTCLLQAFAEVLHEIVRKDYWGYGKEENLSNDDLLQIKYEVLFFDAGTYLYMLLGNKACSWVS